jgi:C4-dicarboxylate-specific signal transduction histidine kinase
MHRGDLATAEKNLGIVGQLAEQAGGIITPLKTFARKSPAVSVAVDVAQAVDSALFLFDQRLRKQNVAVDRKIEPNSWIAWCDQNRLQQVLVNLIGNAIDAMADEPVRRLSFPSSAPRPGSLRWPSPTAASVLPKRRWNTCSSLFSPPSSRAKASASG